MINDVYHILNRGIEKKPIFLDERDYLRFICGLYRFNNKEQSLKLEIKPEDFIKNPPLIENKIVDILKWCIVPNHFHLLIREVIDGGAIEFAKRIGNGYTKYFNIKNERRGYLFQNSAKIILIESDKHFLHMPFYIDANPIKLVKPTWKEEGVGYDESKEIINFLKSYRWSSFKDYFGKENFPSLVDKKSFFDLYGVGREEYLKDFTEWLENH